MHEHACAPDAHWWEQVARIVCGAAVDAAAPGPALGLARARDLSGVTVILPAAAHGPALRAALHAAQGGGACIAPRIATLEEWAGVPLRDGGHEAVVDYYAALRESAWVRDAYGGQAQALWTLAQDLASLADELTLAAVDAPQAFAQRWQAAVRRQYSARAAAAGEPQVQLVLALWLARLDAGSGTAKLRTALAARAAGATGPLVWLLPSGARTWQRAYARAYAARSGQGVHLVQADAAALARDLPWVAAAWPELAGPRDAAPPIAVRARALAQVLGTPSARAPLAILRVDTLEQEALAAAQWTVQQLRDGAARIALVALDRLTARRVRALLERAAVLVQDDSGWKLSTTSAAASVVRWLDLALADAPHALLVEWLRSPFALAGLACKQALTDLVVRAALNQGIHRGAAALRAAVAAQEGVDPALRQEARAWLEQITDLAREWRRPGTLGRYLGLLEATLDRLQMRAALQADAVGATVLEVLQDLQRRHAGSTLTLEPGEFRAFLAGCFEEAGTQGARIQGPVVLTTLRGLRLRRFDAVLLLGADADHLAAPRTAGGLLPEAVRAELGLLTQADQEREMLEGLAALLATHDTVAATWRWRRGDQPVALAAPLERLNVAWELAGQPSLVRPPGLELLQATGAPLPVPAPSAGALLPRQISATGYQDFIDCPYRFFALRMLGLREREVLHPVPDARDFGQLLHALLLDYHRGGPPEDGAARLRALIDEHLAPRLAQQPALVALRERLRHLVPGYLAWQARREAEGWRWVAGERSMDRLLDIGAGSPLRLFGRLDRIDQDAAGRTQLLDYKTGNPAALRRAQREPGEAVQLLFYALLQPQVPDAAAFVSLRADAKGRADPSQAVHWVAAPEPLEQNVQALEERLAADLRRVAGGARLPAQGAPSVCERCELRALCRKGFTAALPVGEAA